MTTGPLLGIDFGLKRTGLAITDSNRRLAVGAGSIQNLSGRRLYRAIKNVAEERSIREVVIGKPSSAGRDANHVLSGVYALADYLKKEGYVISFWDEGYTTSAVLTDIKITGAKVNSRSSSIDEGAAVLILQSYLDNSHNYVDDK